MQDVPVHRPKGVTDAEALAIGRRFERHFGDVPVLVPFSPPPALGTMLSPWGLEADSALEAW